jgi:hypothetical protein
MGVFMNLNSKDGMSIKGIDSQWINDFLTEESKISSSDTAIQTIAKAILSSETLKDLVQDRYLNGNRFLGWTENGSKGYTEVATGNIRIKKTETGTEPFTLGYECINSKNRILYKKIGIKYAFEETNPTNRENFAREILGVEAQAMYVKCKLAAEMGKRELVKDYYLEIYDDQSMDEPTKIEKLKEKMIEKGVVFNGKKPAYEFYKEERYDEIVGYYKEQIKKGNIS